MSTITKELIENILQFNSEGSDCQANAEQWEVHELARIALASLEAEAVITVGDDGGDALAYRRLIQTFAPGTKLYTAPPVPVSVPDDVLKGLLPDAEKAEFWFEHDGKILFEGVKFNNAVFEACRAAMLQEAK